ncbi:MAG: hypothetical protein K0B14_15660 [Anaerolineaceae bacterium]|nr:hypothetical protein [Anaerolineaceae bacterium]
MGKKVFIIISLVGMLFVLSGCFRPLQADPMEADVPAFVPPTLIPATPTNEPIPTQIQNSDQSQPEACIDNLTFIEDKSIPDGTQVNPGSVIEKEWEVKNSGTCSWGSGYTIRLIGGPALEASSPQDLYPARSGTSLTIKIDFIAPEQPGNYRSAWQAYNPSELAFGDSFYIDFVVKAEE